VTKRVVMILHRVFQLATASACARRGRAGGLALGALRCLPAASLPPSARPPGQRGAEGTEREPEPGARQPGPGDTGRVWENESGGRSGWTGQANSPQRAPRRQLQEENNQEAEPPSPRRPPPQARSRAALEPARSEGAGDPGWLSRSRPAARRLSSPPGGFGASERLSPRASRPQGAVRRGARGGRAGRPRRPGLGLCPVSPAATQAPSAPHPRPIPAALRAQTPQRPRLRSQRAWPCHPWTRRAPRSRRQGGAGKRRTPTTSPLRRSPLEVKNGGRAAGIQAFSALATHGRLSPRRAAPTRPLAENADPRGRRTPTARWHRGPRPARPARPAPRACPRRPPAARMG
ncbi:hypothetical protein EI555_003516, partial [Monodon monoceros]